MKLCSKELCVGCMACKNICPKNAIKETHDELLKTIPEINTEQCVNCGLCTSVCPVLQESQYREPVHCYAAWTKNAEDQKDCTSGGIATALSRKILQDGGKVFGCAYDKNLDLNIQAAETENDLERFKGSKYVQSSTADSYQKVQKLLKEGVKVLYIGTPCQIDGLLHFLKEEYDNLFTVDIICHGVPPIEYLKQYVKRILGNKEITNITFRGKNDFELCLYEGQKLEYHCKEYKDVYYKSFLRGLTYRDNCYKCAYAQIKRVSDLTIGDFWGLNKNSLKEPYQGRISVILANTKRGHMLLENCSENVYFEERSLNEAIAQNEQLKHPTEPHKDRTVFEENISRGFIYAVNQTSVGYEIKQIKKCESLPAKVFRKVKQLCHK